MKQWLSLLLILLLVAACRKPASSSATATGTPAPGAPPAASAVDAAKQQAAPAKPVPTDLPAVLARVNGEAIEKWELDAAIGSAEASAGAPVPADRRDEILRNLINQLVEVHLLAQEARARKLEVTDAEVKGQIDQMRQGFPSEEAFKKALADQGGSLDRLQQDVTRRLHVTKLLDQEIAPKLSVQEKDISAFYQENLDRFKEGETVRASHILIGVPQNATAAEQQQARAKADSLLKKVRGGADFAELARAESQDPGSASRGGDLGFIAKGQMVPEFDAAAFQLKAGGVSDLVRTQFGFHIIKQTEQRAPRTAPLAEVSQQIGQFLEARQGEERTAAFLEQLKSKAKVEIYV